MVNLQMESLQQMKVKLTNAYNKEPTNTYSSAYRMKRTILLRVNKYCHSSKTGQTNIKARLQNNCCYGKAMSYIFLCMCVCVRARTRVDECACLCVCGCKCTRAGMCLRARSLTNPACNAPPYCHHQPLWFHRILHYLIKGIIIEKKVIGHKMCVSIFSTTFTWNFPHYTNNSARYCHKRENVFM